MPVTIVLLCSLLQLLMENLRNLRSCLRPAFGDLEVSPTVELFPTTYLSPGS